MKLQLQFFIGIWQCGRVKERRIDGGSDGHELRKTFHVILFYPWKKRFMALSSAWHS